MSELESYKEWWSDEAWAVMAPFFADSARHNDLFYGPAHIVFDDANVEDYWLDWCLTPKANEAAQLEGERLEFVHNALRALQAIPEDRRLRSGKEWFDEAQGS